MATERELIARVEAEGPRELADSVARPSPAEERVLRTHLGSLPIRMLQEKRAVARMQSGILRSPLPDSVPSRLPPGITNQPDELLHLTLDALERKKA